MVDLSTLGNQNLPPGIEGWLRSRLHSLSVSDITATRKITAKGGLQSEEYEAGVSGWSISGDGDVEFNDGTFRGTLDSATIISSTFQTAADGSDRLEINSSGIEFYDSADTLIGTLFVDAADGYADFDGTWRSDKFIAAQGELAGSPYVESLGVLLGQNAARPGLAWDWLYDTSEAGTGPLIGESAFISLQSNRRIRFTSTGNGFEFTQSNVRFEGIVDWNGDEWATRAGDDTMFLQNLNEVRTANGSESDPAYTFDSDQDSGFYLDAAGQVAVAAGGNYLFSWLDSSGDSVIQADSGSIRYDRSATQWKLRLSGVDEFILGTSGLNIPNVYSRTTSSAANLRVLGTGGDIRRSTSSRRYKDDIRPAELDVDALVGIGWFSWDSLADGDDDRRFEGVIAEDVADAGLEWAVSRDDEGRPDEVDHAKLALGMAMEALRRAMVLEGATPGTTGRPQP